MIFTDGEVLVLLTIVGTGLISGLCGVVTYPAYPGLLIIAAVLVVAGAALGIMVAGDRSRN